MTSSVLSQRRNYSNDHGLVFRSSATFYVLSTDKINTIISCMNYFKFKNNIDVSYVVSIRNMNGELRERLSGNFENTAVENFDILNLIGNFEGSLEIEFFSCKELKIPFSAVIGYYKTSSTITAVHTYGRNYNAYEQEVGYPPTRSFESNFTLRDNRSVRSFFVLHNGPREVDSQELDFVFKNHKGLVKTIKYSKVP